MVTSGLSSLLSDAHAIAIPANVRTVIKKLLIPPKNEIMLPNDKVDDEYCDVTVNGIVTWLLWDSLLKATTEIE